jgi:hypothetical protein
MIEGIIKSKLGQKQVKKLAFGTYIPIYCSNENHNEIFQKINSICTKPYACDTLAINQIIFICS